MKKSLLVAVMVAMCFACNGQKNRTVQVQRPEYLPSMDIPSMIADTLEMIRWIETHYWDKFPFADTVAVNDADFTEQAFANFVPMLLNYPREVGDEAIGVMFQKASVDKYSFLKMAQIAEKYLFDPNSPMRDEEFYITSLHAILANPALDQYERIRPQEQLRLAMKNRVGDLSADFSYTLASGTKGTLHTFRAPYTLLFFNNPGCPACALMMEEIGSSAFLSRLITEGTLRVLAIYPDEDLEAWREHTGDFPPTWMNGYDSDMVIKAQELYDLKAIPTLYLLDRSKHVMLKDVMSIPWIENTLYNDLQK